MNDYIREDTEMSKQFNLFVSTTTRLLNEYISRVSSVTTPENKKTFTKEAQDLYDSFYKGKINNNIFEVMKGLFIPLLALAQKHKILEYINLLPSGLILFEQYKFTRHGYFLIYDRFKEELGYAREALQDVHTELG